MIVCCCQRVRKYRGGVARGVPVLGQRWTVRSIVVDGGGRGGDVEGSDGKEAW